MKKLGIALAMTVAAVGAAHAADLPTKKEVAPPPKVNCYSTFWTWLEFHGGGLPADLGAAHGLCDHRHGRRLAVKWRAL